MINTITATEFIQRFKAGKCDFGYLGHCQVIGPVILPKNWGVQTRLRTIPELKLGKLIFRDIFKFSRTRFKNVQFQQARFEAGICLGNVQISTLNMGSCYIEGISMRSKTQPSLGHVWLANCTIRGLFYCRYAVRIYCGQADVERLHTSRNSIINLGSAKIGTLDLGRELDTIHADDGVQIKQTNASENPEAGFIISHLLKTGVNYGKTENVRKFLIREHA